MHILKTLTMLALCTVMLFPQKRAFRLDDLYKVKSIPAFSLSPSEKLVAYSVSTPNLKTGRSKTVLLMMNLREMVNDTVQTGTGTPYSFFWGTSDAEFYYMKTVEGYPQLFQYDFEAKEGKQLTDTKLGVGEPVLSPDGKTIAFMAETYPECAEDDSCNERIANAAADGPIQAYYANDLLFRHWTSYFEGKYNQIFTLDLASGTIKNVTPGPHNSPVFMLGGGVGYNFSQDSKYLCFASNRDKDQALSTNSDLWMLELATGKLVNITAENKAWDGTPTFSPDGSFLAFRKQITPRYESDRFRIAKFDLKTNQITTLTENFDNWVDDILFHPSTGDILFTAQEKGYRPIYRLNPSTGETKLVIGERSIDAFQSGKDFLLYTYRLNHKPSELYILDLNTKKESQLTNLNRELTDQVDLRPAESMWINGSQGTPIHCFVVKPHGFDPSKKYPVVINIHGGPQSQWQDAFRGDNQMYSGYGYIYVLPNTHGSTGYGQAFTAQISGDWGGRNLQDVMLITDSLSKLPYVDADRIGAMGWSYGGYAVNYLQATTKRFKCFASMMGLYNLTSFWGTTEELWFPEWDLKGTPYTSELYKKFSPSEYMTNFSTPTLIVTGEKDYRVSYTQSLEYFTALQRMGIDSRLIVFKNDGHWPAGLRSMPLYYNAHLEWFHKYLGGEPAPYDTETMRRNLAFE